MAATAATSFAGAAEVALAVATPVEVTVPVARSGLVVVGVVVLLVIAFAAVAVVVVCSVAVDVDEADSSGVAESPKGKSLLSKRCATCDRPKMMSLSIQGPYLGIGLTAKCHSAVKRL